MWNVLKEASQFASLTKICIDSQYLLLLIASSWRGICDIIRSWFDFFVFQYSHFRHILASLHFNENVQRATQVGKNGLEYIKVSYPKYKLGEEVVRDVKTPPSYGKYILCTCIPFTQTGFCFEKSCTTFLLDSVI